MFDYYLQSLEEQNIMGKEKFTQELKFFLKKRGIKQNDIARELGVSHPVVSNIVNGRDKIGKTTALKWADALGIDPLWLMTQGEQGTPPGDGAPLATLPQEDIIMVPVLNWDSRGGFLANSEVDMEEYVIDMMPFSRSVAKAGDVVVQVYGDSMLPKYPSGCYILIRPIEMWREYIELGKSYVLELADWRRIIKIVRKGSDSQHYLLESYNPKFESDEVAKNFIAHVWMVVVSVNREAM